MSGPQQEQRMSETGKVVSDEGRSWANGDIDAKAYFVAAFARAHKPRPGATILQGSTWVRECGQCGVFLVRRACLLRRWRHVVPDRQEPDQ